MPLRARSGRHPPYPIAKGRAGEVESNLLAARDLERRIERQESPRPMCSRVSWRGGEPLIAEADRQPTDPAMTEPVTGDGDVDLPLERLVSAFEQVDVVDDRRLRQVHDAAAPF